MEIKSEAFKAASAKVFKGILIAFGAAIVAGILAIIGAASAISGAMAGSDGAMGVGSFMLILAGIAGLVGVYGYFVQYQGAGELEQSVDAEDAPFVGKIKMAFLLLLIGIAVSALLSFVPVIGIAGTIISAVLNIVGSIFCLMAFKALKESATFPEKEGAAKLYTAYLLYVIGYGCAITIILAWATSILNLIGFIFALIGWSKMKK